MDSSCDTSSCDNCDHSFKNQEEYFKWISEAYEIPIDKIPICFAKDFDFSKCEFKRDRSDLQTTIEIENGLYTIDVDRQLAPLMEILNKDEMVADDCRYMNYFGYSSVDFKLQGFEHWIHRLHEAAMTKHNTTDSDFISDLPIIKRFSWSWSDQTSLSYSQESKTNMLIISTGLYSGDQQFRLGVGWKFLPSDIDEIVQQLKDLDL